MEMTAQALAKYWMEGTHKPSEFMRKLKAAAESGVSKDTVMLALDLEEERLMLEEAYKGVKDEFDS